MKASSKKRQILLSHIKLVDRSIISSSEHHLNKNIVGILILMQKLTHKLHLLPVFLQEDRRLAVQVDDHFVSPTFNGQSTLQEMVIAVNSPFTILRLVFFDDQLRATAQNICYPFPVISAKNEIALPGYNHGLDFSNTMMTSNTIQPNDVSAAPIVEIGQEIEVFSIF